MRAQIVRFDELQPWQLDRWDEFRRRNAAYDSPFFCPEFTQVVASVREDVRVALLEEQGELVGVLPFQLGGPQQAHPVGAGFCEFHGPLFAPEAEWTVSQLLEACGWRAWHYDHLPLALEPFRPYHHRVGDSPYLDLTDGYESYCRRKRDAGSKLVERTQHKARKLQRDHGPLELEIHSRDPATFACLLNWKGAQHRRTNVTDVFQLPWVVQLLRNIRDIRTERFAGVFSVLRAGGIPVAVHLGMRTNDIIHLWYPTFDLAFSKYSPGAILFLKLAEAFAADGAQRLDFGPGDQPYKSRFMTGAVPVALGVADRSRWRSAVRRQVAAARHWARSTTWLQPIRAVRHASLQD